MAAILVGRLRGRCEGGDGSKTVMLRLSVLQPLAFRREGMQGDTHLATKLRKNSSKLLS